MMNDNKGSFVTKTEKYERLQTIGEGTYGIVYKARDIVTKEIVAVK